MNFRTSLFALTAMLALAIPAFAAKSSSSSDSRCCKKVKKLVKDINRTTTQDFIVDTNTNFAVQQINQTTQEILSILETETSCINFIASVPYEISAPGYYRVVCDLFFSPTDDGTNAITVDEDLNDVTIDFAQFVLSMDPTVTTADNNGILISEGCEVVGVFWTET